MTFANFSAQLRLNIQNFAQNLDTASKMMGRFASNAAGSSTTVNRNFAQYGRNIADATNKLHKHNFGLKDTARIVQGILVSQAFYTMAGYIRDATSALWNFNEALDYAGVTYSALFGSQELGTAFLATLREHAEETIFSYEQLANSSKKLLAYNIPYENLMYVMEGLTNLGAMSGDAAALDRIALALGQIYTRGKLSAEEMRQLANAYVPIYEIVQSKFGLTDDQMGSVGNLNLPAADVINAVVDYANEKFANVGDAAMLTITGLKQKISDALMNLGVDILKPVTAIYKSLLVEISKGTTALREAYNAGGLGGIFERLVPDEDMQMRIRQFFANIQALFKTFMTLLHSAGQVMQAFGTGFINVFNVLAPILNSAANILAGMIQIVTSNAAAMRVLSAALAVAASMWVLFRAKALGAMVVVALSKAIYGVASAVLLLSRILAASPIVTGLILIATGLAGIAAVSKRADSAISSLFNKLTALNGGGGGIGRDGVLQLKDQLDGATSSADKFNNRLDGVSDSIEDTGNAADAAGKKAKKAAAGLLSFDEVFKLNQPTDTSSAGAGGAGDFNLDDMLGGIGALGEGLADALIPDIPDLSEFATDFINNMKDSLLAKLGLAGLGAMLASRLLKQIQSFVGPAKGGAAAGKIAAALAKALMGGFIGYGFDALASLITDKLWEAIEGALKLKEGSAEQASFGATIGSIIGGAIGGVVGGLPGSVIGAAIGHLAGGIVGLFWQTIDGAFNNTTIGFGTGILTAIAGAFGGSIKQLPGLVSSSTFAGFFKNIGDLFKVTGLKSLAKGGIIGAAVGFVVDTLAALLWGSLAESLNLSAEATGNAKVGQTIGGILGTVIGGLLGGPVGAILGSAIGTFAGGFVGLFWEKIVEFFQPVTDAVTNIATSIATVFGDWWANTSSGFKSWWEDTSAGFTGWFSDTKKGLSSWWSDTTAGFSDWWSGSNSGFNQWLKDTIATFSDWDSITSETLGNWWKDTNERLSSWWSNTTDGFRNWKSNTINSVSDWSKETIAKFAAWVIDTKLRFDKWKFDSIKPIKDWASDAASSIATWVTNTVKSIGDWVNSVVKSFNEFKDRALGVIGGFATAAVKAVSKWLADTKTEIYNWFTKQTTEIATLWNKLWNPKNWKAGWTSIKEWFSDLFSDIRNWFSSLGSSVSTWWDGLWSNKSASVSASVNTGRFSLGGHATGGIFTKEHIARFAEGNKAEMAVPLENASAMQPFVDAIAHGILEGLAPTLMQSGGSHSELPPMYVGTLIGDDRGLKELYKRFNVIQAQENARRGITPTMA